MSDSERWSAGSLPADFLHALDLAKREQPSPDVVERCTQLAAGIGTGVIGVAAGAKGAGAAGALTTGAAGTSSGLGAVVLVKWGLGGLVVGGALMTSAALVHHRQTAPPAAAKLDRALVTAPASVRTIAPPRPTRVEQAHVNQARVNQAHVNQARVEQARVNQARVNPAAGSSVAEAEAESSALWTSASTSAHPRAAVSPKRRLREELTLLERARVQLDSGHLTQASALLDEHDRRFGAGAPLAPEARYLKLMLEQARQQPAETRALAREILERDPTGPHAARARAVLDKE